MIEVPFWVLPGLFGVLIGVRMALGGLRWKDDADNCTGGGMIKRELHPNNDGVREMFAQVRDLTLLAMFLIGMALMSGWARAW